MWVFLLSFHIFGFVIEHSEFTQIDKDAGPSGAFSAAGACRGRPLQMRRGKSLLKRKLECWTWAYTNKMEENRVHVIQTELLMVHFSFLKKLRTKRRLEKCPFPRPARGPPGFVDLAHPQCSFGCCPSAASCLEGTCHSAERRGGTTLLPRWGPGQGVVRTRDTWQPNNQDDGFLLD